ncbi:MAG: acyl-CoA thioesterase [Chloroflexota bacterium]
MAEKPGFVAETTFRVRYAETDSMRIVHHRNYLVYFEEGRSEYARLRGYPYGELERQGTFLAVTEVNIRYVKPALYEQQITVRTWLTGIQSRGMAFAYEIVDTLTDEILVEGSSKHICIDRDGKVTRLPDTWRAWKDDLPPA